MLSGREQFEIKITPCRKLVKILNLKMKNVADEIGYSILRFYNEDYLESIFRFGIQIEDVIFQILVECCRYAYLKNAEKHPQKFYIERDGLELELERKNLKRTIDYSNSRFEIKNTRMQDPLGIQPLRPDVKPVKIESNRFPRYDMSEFQYWEAQNIHSMALVKAIVEKRIGSSKKISDTRFTEIASQFDNTLQKFKDEFGSTPEKTVFSSLVLFTLEGKYAFNLYYALASEMVTAGVTEMPDMYNRLMTISGTYKYASSLPDLEPEYAHDGDLWIEYPMISLQQRFIPMIVRSPIGGNVEFFFKGVMEANVLANAVQSHIYLNRKPMRVWFDEDTNLEDWASVFETYDIFRSFIPDKSWTQPKIQAVRKMYETVSIDYKTASRKSSIENKDRS